MNVRIKKDQFRYIGSDCHKLRMQLCYLLFTPRFQYTYLMRKCQKGGVFKFFWMILLRWCMFKMGIQIPYQTIIGEGLYIAHFGNIIVNPGAKIGKNFTIAAGALVGFYSWEKNGTSDELCSYLVNAIFSFFTVICHRKCQNTK